MSSLSLLFNKSSQTSASDLACSGVRRKRHRVSIKWDRTLCVPSLQIHTLPKSPCLFPCRPCFYFTPPCPHHYLTRSGRSGEIHQHLRSPAASCSSASKIATNGAQRRTANQSIKLWQGYKNTTSVGAWPFYVCQVLWKERPWNVSLFHSSVSMFWLHTQIYSALLLYHLVPLRVLKINIDASCSS